jgi:hypothetical protein
MFYILMATTFGNAEMNKPDLRFCCVLVWYLCLCSIYLCNLCSSPLRLCCVLVRYFCTCNPGIYTVVIGVHNHRGLKGLFTPVPYQIKSFDIRILITPLVSSNSSYIFNVLLIKKYLYKKKSTISKTLYL